MGMEDTPMTGWRERENSGCTASWGNRQVSELTRGMQPRPGLWAFSSPQWHSFLPAPSWELGAEMSNMARALEESHPDQVEGQAPKGDFSHSIETGWTGGSSAGIWNSGNSPRTQILEKHFKQRK